LHLLDLAELRAPFHVERILITDWRPRYNIAPSQLAPVVRAREQRTLEALRWGLSPQPAKSGRDGSRLINARVESIAQRPSFRDAFRERRCIVPATGYFEWQAVAGRQSKQPFWARPDDGSVLALAGLWEPWRAPDGDATDSFAIVTTEARGALRSIHDRMPLCLRAGDVERWLRPGTLPKKALDQLVLATSDVNFIGVQEVDSRVGSPAFDEPACIEPPAASASAARQRGLFD
jgi:putative SOS response-associated peptidase YedK